MFFGHPVEALNITTPLGLPVDIVAFFRANRLFPLALLAEWEIHVLFIAWLAMLLFMLAPAPLPCAYLPFVSL